MLFGAVLALLFLPAGGREKRAMEDFCQLDEMLTQDKYKGSYERCAKLIKKYSSIPALDMAELFLRLVFSFAVGNSDMHLKNFSLIETAPESGVYVLSPAYDLLSVNLVMPEDKEQFALPMNGKKTNLRRKDFLIFADTAGDPLRGSRYQSTLSISSSESSSSSISASAQY